MHYVKYETLRFEYLREQARRSLWEFFKGAWPVLEPGTELVEGWHMQVICEHLDAVRRGEIQKLIINLPPGFCKSLIVACAFNAHVWIESPGERFLSASYSRDLSIRDTRRTRNIVRSEWYQNNWGPKSDWSNPFRILGDQNVKSSFENNHRGWRIGTSVGGSTTGQRGSYLISDDPMRLDDAASEAAIVKTRTWYRDVWGSRKTDPKIARDIVIQQRLNQQDPSGYLMKEIGGYELLILPMRKPKKDYPNTSLGRYDKRKPGELLDPKRYPEEVVRAEEKRLGSFGTAAQLQQDPKAADSDLFQHKNFVFYITSESKVSNPYSYELELHTGQIVECEVVMLPDTFNTVIQSWDASFGVKRDTSSSVAGHIWGVVSETYYLLDRAFGKWSFPETIDAIRKMIRKYPITGKRVLIEGKANGPALLQVLRNEFSGLISINPKGSKVARAHACVPAHESGNIVFPHPEERSWVLDLVDLITEFPFSESDDDVDAMSQLIEYHIGAPIITIT